MSLLFYLHWFIVLSFPIFISYTLVLLRLFSPKLTINADEKFNYIIVGGGSAGASLAERLSRNSRVRVLLVEAGSRKPIWLNIPALGSLHQLTDFDWQYKTIPQKHGCHALKNNESVWPLGKALGGSTHLNYMLYVPGFPEDFASWKDPESNHWSEKDISYYFHQVEGGREKYAVPVRDSVYTTPLSSAVLAAAEQLGFPVNSTRGFYKPKLNINNDGSRWTADQFIQHSRPNLKVVTDCQVKKILLLDNFEATGVNLECLGDVHASREVILAAGTVGSAHLLMLSGIGPPEALDPAKVPVKVNLPVGRNLQDHVTTGLDLLVLNSSIFSMAHLTSPTAAKDYLLWGQGPFTSALCEAVGFVSTVRPSTGLVDLQLMVMMAGVSSDGGLFSRHSMGLSQGVWDSFYSKLVGQPVATILPVLLHPRSRGVVQLNPHHPAGPPQIDPNYLSDSQDVASLVEGVRLVQRLTETPAMRGLGAWFNSAAHPGCEDEVFGSQLYWECYVRQVTITSYHPIGTCAMGSVVDHRLRVLNTNRLRVVDASVMPSFPSGNTNAAVLMIAAKAADLVQEDLYALHTQCYLTQVFVPTSQYPVCSCVTQAYTSIGYKRQYSVF